MKEFERWKISKKPFEEKHFKGNTIKVLDKHSGLHSAGVLMLDDEDELSALVCRLKDDVFHQIKMKEIR